MRISDWSSDVCSSDLYRRYRDDFSSDRAQRALFAGTSSCLTDRGADQLRCGRLLSLEQVGRRSEPRSGGSMAAHRIHTALLRANGKVTSRICTGLVELNRAEHDHGKSEEET